MEAGSDLRSCLSIYGQLRLVVELKAGEVEIKYRKLSV